MDQPPIGMSGQACYDLERLAEDGEITEPSAKKMKTERKRCGLFPCCARGTDREAELVRAFGADPSVASWQRARAGDLGASSMALS